MSEERKFDEAAFDKAVAKPNGWSGVADPVAEIRRMRDGDEAFGKDVLRTALSLVRAHFDGAEDVFLEKSRELAARLDEEGRGDLASFVRAQTGDEPSWVPMERKQRDEIDAILAEARNKYTVHECNECDYRKSCDLRFDCDECKTKRQSISLALGIEDGYFTKLLDQIDAAAKKMRAMLDGNIARVRELEAMLDGAANTVLGCAIKQKQSTPGNVAALRDALNDACFAMFEFLKKQHGGFSDMANALDKGKAALAAPARNCDRFFTAKKAMRAFDEMCEQTPFCRNDKCEVGQFRKTVGGPGCIPGWLFATMKEKETENV